MEVGGKLYTKLVESGDITSDQHTPLKNFILDSQKNKDVVKKEKVVEMWVMRIERFYWNNWQVLEVEVAEELEEELDEVLGILEGIEVPEAPETDAAADQWWSREPETKMKKERNPFL